MINILLIDNNDSFTYNLVQLIEQCGANVVVMNESNYNQSIINESSAIVLSPGPGLPNDFSMMMEVIDKYHNSKPILGVCLGHQALAVYFGAKLSQVNKVRHGIKSYLKDTEGMLYNGLVNPIAVGRYHSWTLHEPLPANLRITSRSENDNLVMSYQHTNFNINGIQYHPESVITEKGVEIMKNWTLDIL